MRARRLPHAELSGRRRFESYDADAQARILEVAEENVLTIAKKRMQHPFPGVDLLLIIEKTGSNHSLGFHVYRLALTRLEAAGRLRRTAAGILVLA